MKIKGKSLPVTTDVIDAVSRDFERRLEQTLSQVEMSQVIITNYVRNDSTCASADYCDSNVCMWQAFRAVKRRDPDLQSEDDVRLFEAAWIRFKSRTSSLAVALISMRNALAVVLNDPKLNALIRSEDIQAWRQLRAALPKKLRPAHS